MLYKLKRRTQPCTACGGSGKERHRVLLSGGEWKEVGDCPICEGSGSEYIETDKEHATRLQKMLEEMLNLIYSMPCEQCPIAAECHTYPEGPCCDDVWVDYLSKAIK